MEHHFRSNDHDFERDTKFTLIERMKKITDIKSTLENQEEKSIRYLLTYSTFGFNMKLYYPCLEIKFGRHKYLHKQIS